MTRAIKALTVSGALIVPTILAGTYLVEALQPAGSTYELQVTGRAGVPATASAVVLNITSAGARGTGFIIAWPCGSPRPNASNLNYGVGAPVANSAIVKIGTDGKVCLFTADNDTELIADVNGWFPAGADYTSTSPARILDTRAALSTVDAVAAGEGRRTAGSTYELQVTGRAGVPATASAVVLNITSAGARGTGFIIAWPCGSPRPNASNLNYGVGAPVANSAIVKIGTDGKVCLFTADNDTELIADVNGWFPAGADYTSTSPARILDTRAALSTVDAVAAGEGRRTAGSTYELQVTGRAGVPATASAVVLNITSAGARGTGFIIAWPCGSPRPNASNLNYGVGAPVANSAIVKIGTDGKVCLFTADNDTELIADVNGWFPTNGTNPGYVAITPQRLLDTRDDMTSGAAFVETFTGNTGLQRFRTGVFYRERDAFVPPRPEWIGDTPWLADHNIALADCGDPTTNHHLVSARDWVDPDQWWVVPTFHDDRLFYSCRDHMMTTMGDLGGYSVAWFSPNQSFTSIRRVCWDVDVASNINGHRQWWEVAVQPVGTPDASAVDWLGGVANLPSYGQVGAVVLGFGPDNPPFPQLHVGDNEVGGGSVAEADRNSITRRVPHCLVDNKNGTITYSNDTNGGFTSPGAFPAGPLKVVFKSHGYTPNKDCSGMNGLGGPGTCKSYSWHWDNIIVE